MKARLKEMTLDELTGFFSEMGEKPFRAKQLWRWMYTGDAPDFDAMTDLSAELRGRLSEAAELFMLRTAATRVSEEDGTRKYAFETADGNLVESVMMRYKHGNTVCVSSQAGCRMACAFCASGLLGLTRNLRAGEMTDQLLLAQNDAGERISHVVIMGTGEPLDNFNAVKRFIETVSREDGPNISRRNITVSTCGLVPGIRQMAAELPQVGLAVSLHAPDDALRSALLPVNKKYGISTLLEAVRGHVAETGRRATVEYALIRGVNDSAEHAKKLVYLLRGINCHVNLISLNKVRETKYVGSGREEAGRFNAVLSNAGIQATLRRELGTDIDAACGQLRLTLLKK
jgi:23S rRNA (adenine2503-C2)-methyltransferase